MPAPVCRPSLWLLCGLGIAALTVPRAARAEPPPAPRPVFFVPFRLLPSLEAQRKLLEGTLSSELISSRRYVKAVSAQTQATLRECVAGINKDTTAEQCWVRVGQGQGAELMATGSTEGDASACTLSLALTELETRVTTAEQVVLVQPCSVEALVEQVRQGARKLGAMALAGGPDGGPGAGGPLAAPPPPVVSSGPSIVAAEVTASTGNLVVEARPFGEVRLELQDPSGTPVVSGSPYRNPEAKVGRWEVVARAAGRVEARRSVEVPPDETTLVKLELPLLGGLRVTGEPAGSRGRVTGPSGCEHEGGLPWVGQGLMPGSYRVEVSRKAYAPVSMTVAVESGKTSERVIRLARPELTQMLGLAPGEAPGQQPAAGETAADGPASPPSAADAETVRIAQELLDVGLSQAQLASLVRAKVRLTPRAPAIAATLLTKRRFPAQEVTQLALSAKLFEREPAEAEAIALGHAAGLPTGGSERAHRSGGNLARYYNSRDESQVAVAFELAGAAIGGMLGFLGGILWAVDPDGASGDAGAIGAPLALTGLGILGATGVLAVCDGLDVGGLPDDFFDHATYPEIRRAVAVGGEGERQDRVVQILPWALPKAAGGPPGAAGLVLGLSL